MDKKSIIETKTQLIEYFQDKEKNKKDWMIGTEHEKFIFSLKNFHSVDYKGENGIEQLLLILEKNSGWEGIYENKNIIGLIADNKSSISLEPGGQLELSGAPLKNLHMTCEETGTHLKELRKALQRLDLGMAGFGFHPISARENSNFMPKGRYEIMKKWMPKVGSMGLDMMLRTCTIQVNLDYSNEIDMAKKFKTALTLQPIITALFANSPFYEGKPSNFLSLRTEVWRNTDPSRCGVPTCIFDNNFGYEMWVDYLLNVPMYFIYRDCHYHDVAGSSFNDFLNGKLKNFEGVMPTIKDWEDHMSVAFTDVRLKGYLEMRGADGGPWDRICALPAVWVGLLYNEVALKSSEDLAKQISYNEVIEATISSSKLGLKGKIAKFKIDEIAKEILNIAKFGLQSRQQLNSSGDNETGYLAPLFSMVENKKTLADEMLENYSSIWNKKTEMAFKNQMI